MKLLGILCLVLHSCMTRGALVRWVRVREGEGGAEGYSNLDGLRVWRGVMKVPVTYDGKGLKEFPQESLQIHVESFQKDPVGRDCAGKHLILLAGGPGQSAHVWYPDLPAIAKLLSRGMRLYLLDVRGVGRSDKLCDEDDSRWRDANDEFIPPHDPARYSVTNTAHDIAQLAKLIIKRHQRTGGEQVLVSLMGVSFGGMLAARAVVMCPRLFEWLILDSPSMVKGRFDEKNDIDFWNCVIRMKLFDRRLLRSWRAGRRIYHRLVSGERNNACTEAIAEEEAIGDLLWPLFRGESFLQDRFQGWATAITFMLHAYKCPNPSYFQYQVLPKMRKICRSPLPLNDEGAHVQLHLAKPEFMHGIHEFHNAYTCISEIYRYPGIPAACGKGKLRNVADQCPNWRHYQPAFKRLAELRYPLDEFLTNPINTDRTKIVVMMGEMDVVTPPRLTQRWLEGVKSPLVSVIRYEGEGHTLFPDVPCLSKLFQMLSGEGSTLRKYRRRLREIQDCIAEANIQKRSHTHKAVRETYLKEWAEKLQP